jgi:hypothetical protein
LRRLGDLALLRAYYGAVPVLSLACAAGACALWLARVRTPLVAASVAVAAFAAAAYTPNLVPRVVFPEYFAAVFPLCLALASWCFGSFYQSASAPARRALAAGAAAFAFFQVASFVGQRHLLLSKGDPDLAEIHAAGEWLAARVPRSHTLVTLDTYLAVESGLDVPPGFEMGIFSYFPNRSDADGVRLRVLTPGRLAAALRSRDVGAAALSDHALGILVEKKITGYRPKQELGQAELEAAIPELAGYRLERVFEDFGQFDDRLYVLMPVRDARPR